MNKKKILTGSIVMAMTFSVIGPISTALSKGDIHPFVSQAYAAGDKIEFGEGRTLEVINEPSVKNKSFIFREVKNFKIRLAGFKEGDKLNIKDSIEFMNVTDPNNHERKVSYRNILPNNYSIKELSRNIDIATVEDGNIIFNSNIRDFKTVDFLVEFVYSSNDLYYLTSNPSDQNVIPVNGTFYADFTDSKGVKQSLKPLAKYTIKKEDVLIREDFDQDKIFLGREIEIVKEENGVYTNSSYASLRPQKPFYKGDIIEFSLFIPDDMEFEEKIEEGFVPKLVFRNKYVLLSDYDKGKENVGRIYYNRSKDGKEFSDYGLKFDIDTKRDEERKGTVYSYKVVNTSDELDGEYIGFMFPILFRANYNLEDLSFDLDNNLVEITNPKKIPEIDFTMNTKDKSGKTKVYSDKAILGSQSIPSGYVDANGVWRPYRKKPTGAVQTVEVGTKPKVEDFILNYKDLSNVKKVVYKDKEPDVSKEVNKMPIDVIVHYKDKDPEEVRGYLNVIPRDLTKYTKINYELENGKKVKSEEVLKINATKVATPETDIPQGYELVNWVKK